MSFTKRLGYGKKSGAELSESIEIGGMKMKKILVIQGGGRANGNTAQLVQNFARGAVESGHEVEIISLIKHEVKGCLG